jgi:hypothetical protein
MKKIQPLVDVKNLVRELADNKIWALELVREALSNAKDHGATKAYIRTWRGSRNEVSVVLIDDGEGMTDAGLQAFWGIGASEKAAVSGHPIGYKGHGTKLYFGSERLTVATAIVGSAWRVTSKAKPAEHPSDSLDVSELKAESAIAKELERAGKPATGTAILIEQIGFSDATELLSRRAIESYCDWFTVVGDVRSGLFDTRKEFHDAVKAGGRKTESLRTHEGSLRAITVHLQANGEAAFSPLGFGPSVSDKDFLTKWTDDLVAHRANPGLAAYGHRFADQHESGAGAHRVRDDLSAIRLTSPEDWVTEDGISIVARVEGHRRQRETYLEASWQHKQGLYSFEDRFGLWLCRDFVPVTQRNDLLRKALDRASKGHLQFDFGSLRNWQVFINDQQFLPTANRNDVSNQSDREPRFVDALVEVLSRSMKQQGFLQWIDRLRRAKHERQRGREVAQMNQRRDEVEAWINSKAKKDGIDPMLVKGLPALHDDESLLLRAPRSEQELFYVYGLLSARYEMPVHVLEYNASQGVDAIGLLRQPKLVSPPAVHARIEFKHIVGAKNPIDHYFDAIDLIICWKVDPPRGPVYEESSSGDTVGTLRPRAKPILRAGLDTHEIVYEQASGKQRVIPVLQLKVLFPTQKKAG